MQNPIVTICITTYNHERYIRECLESVLCQGLEKIEILVGDDISEDGTGQAVLEIEKRNQGVIKYIRHKSKMGASDNLKFLIREARGKYIAHLDGDDFWLPGKLTKEIAELETHTELIAVYSNAFCINDMGTPVGVFSNFKETRIRTKDLVRLGNFLNHSSLLYRASFAEKILALQGPLLDYKIHLLLSTHGILGYLGDALVVYRVNSSTSMLANQNDHVRDLYWASLSEFGQMLESPVDLSKGYGEFMRAIFFRSIRMRSSRLIRVWWPRIIRQAPAGRFRLLLQALSAIVRATTRELADILSRRLLNNPVKVLYPV